MTSHFAIDIALGIFLRQRLTFIAFGATLSKRKFNFGATIFEIQTERDERQAFLTNSGREAGDLAAIEQQLARSIGIVGSHAMGELIGRDVHSLDPYFAIVKTGVGVNDLDMSITQAFDLATLQHDASFDDIQNGVVVARLAIAGDELGAGGGHSAFRLRLGRQGDTLQGVEATGDALREELFVTPEVYEAMSVLAVAEYPLEACGLMAGEPGSNRITRFFPCRNIEQSARIYTIDPVDHLRAERTAEDAGLEIRGVMHSHTHTEAFPSATDVSAAPDPDWHYLIVTLKRETPEMRTYRIVKDLIAEVTVEILR